MRRLRVAWLPDGKRLHLKNGPVNLILQAFGRPGEIGRAYDAAIERARALVLELAEDLPRLQAGDAPLNAVGLRAAAACAAVPGALGAVTALTGAVADEVLAAMAQRAQMERAFVNNHGAVAFHLAEGQSITPNAMDWPDYQRYDARVPIVSAARARGLAAGGWHYEGFALGCVDKIYLAAPSAAVAEAALGSIAACMLPASGAQTVPAEFLAPHSVLGSLPVYPPLQALAGDEAAAILAQGRAASAALFAAGTITLALAGLGEDNFLVALPYLSLKSMLSLEA
jgi:ApbE superfamily uncharacterized protein (UPF0280 family)